MKIAKTFTILLILVLLLGNASPMSLRPTQAAEPQEGVARIVEPLKTMNGADATEQPPFDFRVGEPVEPGGPFSTASVSSLPSVLQSSASNWHIECVDCPKWFERMTDRSLQLDADDHPHIAYGGERLYYAWHDGTEYHYETVDETLGVGSFTSLMLDGFDRPHIGYLGGYPNYDLKYAWHDGTAWQIETVDSDGDVGYPSLALALDGSDRPHISYASNGGLKYAWHDGTGWYTETVDSDGGVGYPSLALDETDRPHISYYDAANDNLKYAWYDGASWHIETVDDGDVYMPYSSLALDGTGRPHITYFILNLQGSPAGENLRYAWHDGTTWHIETMDYEGGGYSSLVLDGEGHPHIGYYVPAGSFISGKLKYAWNDGTGWHIETVDDSAESVGKYVSLVLDGSGWPHISYYDVTNDDLKYAWHDGAEWHTEVVDSSGRVGTYVSLAMDGSGRPHIGYLQGDYDYCKLKYAWHDGAAWWTEVVNIGLRCDQVSLALDGADRPHVCYRGSDFDLEYGWHDGTDWYTETVDSDSSVGMDPSLALDVADHPHVSYHDRGDGNLKYAWYDGMNWHIEIVDSEEDVGSYFSLALDGAGHPHIGYYSLRSGDLKYAWYNGIEWQIEIVDSVGSVGKYASLALDGANRPHIGYYDDTNDDLKYAWYDGVSWRIETVDSEGVVGQYTSLALDWADSPHVSYFDETNDNLKYAWYDGASWHIEIVDSEEDVGRGTSLALDGLGRPHISYHDVTNGDLKYARRMLFVSKQAAPDDRLYTNDTLTYTLTFAGSGQSVRLWDPLPDTVLYVPGSIIGAVTPPAVYSPTVRAVIWQGTLLTGTVQVVRFQVTANVAGMGTTPVPIVNTAWLTDTENGTVISSTATVNVLPPPFYLRKQATPDDGLRNNEPLTCTLTISGPGLNAHLWDPLPANVRYLSDSITSTVTPAAVYSPTAHAVLWAGMLPTDTVQTIRFQVTPKIIDTGALPWPMPLAITNTAWLTDMESGWSITATAAINVLPPPLYLRKQATPDDGLRNNEPLTYTLTISGPGLNVRLWDPLSPIVRYVPGSITDTIGIVSGTLKLPAAVYSPTAHAVVWQGTLPTNTVEVIRFQVTPGITRTGSLSLSLPIVNTAWLTDTESGWSVSATVIVNGCHLYLPLVLRIR